MNSIEPNVADNLARALFDEIVAPLALARRAAGVAPYFVLCGDAGAASYFETTAAPKTGPADFKFPGGGDTDGLVEALANFWEKEGEVGLAAMTPRLKEIAAALRNEASEANAEVDILCYTMF